MPATYSYPGVYIEEIPSSVRTIAGVSTSDTAFIDYFKRGDMNKAVRVTSWADFERKYGGLDAKSEASYAIMQYYQNGGQIAWVVRTAAGVADAAWADLPAAGSSPGPGTLRIQARSPGSWGNSLYVAASQRQGQTSFNLTVREIVVVNGKPQVVASETHLNLSTDLNDRRYAVNVIEAESELLRVIDSGMGATPSAVSVSESGELPFIANPTNPSPFLQLTSGTDGNPPDAAALKGNASSKTGMYALDDIEPFVFNLMCIPRAAELSPISQMESVYSDALTYCQLKRAFLIIDVPDSISSQSSMATWKSGTNLRSPNAAVYWPRLRVPDPLKPGQVKNVAASGTLAGVYARTDTGRGVWKAPAGIEAVLRNASIVKKMTDLENGGLNPLGVNALRAFPIYGQISWGARTMEGADALASEWKYVPIRRLALYIEESLFQGTKWVVFEPNDEPLWAQIRLNVGAFMHSLFRQGAFQGRTPREAYFAKCDAETTTQNDRDRGIVNILVGFAPLKPAEFVVIKISQMQPPPEA